MTPGCYSGIPLPFLSYASAAQARIRKGSNEEILWKKTFLFVLLITHILLLLFTVVVLPVRIVLQSLWVRYAIRCETSHLLATGRFLSLGRA